VRSSPIPTDGDGLSFPATRSPPLVRPQATPSPTATAPTGTWQNRAPKVYFYLRNKPQSRCILATLPPPITEGAITLNWHKGNWHEKTARLWGGGVVMDGVSGLLGQVAASRWFVRVSYESSFQCLSVDRRKRSFQLCQTAARRRD